MDNNDRVKKAEEIKSRLKSAPRGNNCLSCRYIRLTEWSHKAKEGCVNPILRNQESDEISGAVDVVEARTARSYSGLCGPDGILWEPKPLYAFLMPQYYRSDLAKVSIIGVRVIFLIAVTVNAILWLTHHA